MYKLAFFISLIFVTLFGMLSNHEKVDSDEITICHTGPSEMMAFTLDPKFIAFHPTPKEIDFIEKGENITFPAADGKDASGYFLKAKVPSDKWLFVFQEWWGLNDNIKEESDRLFTELGEKVNVLALDMYDGKVTSNPQEAGSIMRGTTDERLENIVKAAIKKAGPDAEIGTIGWCFGGSWSLKSALMMEEQNIGSVIYYGMPVREVEKLKKLEGDVLGIFATEENISEGVIKEFAEAMDEADKDLDYKIYPAVHGFANPSNPRHDVEATKDANERTLAFLKERFN